MTQNLMLVGNDKLKLKTVEIYLDHLTGLESLASLMVHFVLSLAREIIERRKSCQIAINIIPLVYYGPIRFSM